MNAIHTIIAWIKNKVLSKQNLDFVLLQLKKIANATRPRERFRNTKTYAALMQMPTLKRRMIVMLVSVFVLLGLVVGFNQLKTLMFNYFMSGLGLPPASVTTMVIEKQEWQPKMTSVGNVRAFRGVDLSTEIGGLVLNVPIKSGLDVKEGDLLIKLNDAADLAQLEAMKAMADLAKVINERDKAQLAIQAISKNVYDTSTADMKAKRAQACDQPAPRRRHAIRIGRIGRNRGTGD